MKKLLAEIDITVIVRNAFYVFAILIGSIVVSFELYRFLMLASPPMKYVDVHIQTPEVQAGGVMFVSFTLNRTRFCRTEIDRFITSADGSILYWRDTVPGGVGDTGKFTVVGKVPISETMLPGDYKFLARSYAMCQEGIHMATHPRLPFKVVK